jgi:2'-5' RNA ligase
MADRCFVAIDIDNEVVKNALVEAQRTIEASGADVKSVERDNIHITLRFLGEIPEAKTARVADAVRSIEFKPIKLFFEGIGVFPSSARPNVIWAGVTGDVPEILAVFTALEEELEDLGFESERRGFQPHLTLCRVRSLRNISVLVDVLGTLENARFGELEVRCIRLKKSVLTSRGPIYSNVAESRSI